MEGGKRELEMGVGGGTGRREREKWGRNCRRTHLSFLPERMLSSNHKYLPTAPRIAPPETRLFAAPPPAPPPQPPTKFKFDTPPPSWQRTIPPPPSSPTIFPTPLPRSPHGTPSPPAHAASSPSPSPCLGALPRQLAAPFNYYRQHINKSKRTGAMESGFG
jgi:hypothetical protein